MGAFPGPFICSCFCSEPGLCSSTKQLWAGPETSSRRQLASCHAFARPAPANPPALRSHRRFRYCFESAKARQTVRWGRFRAFEFALEKGVKTRRAGLRPRRGRARRRKRSSPSFPRSRKDGGQILAGGREPVFRMHALRKIRKFCAPEHPANGQPHIRHALSFLIR